MGYRFGFQGQEEDGEVHNGSYTAQFWQYDSRLGRRWNIDPVVKIHESPYSALANNPIWFIDPTGADTTTMTKEASKELEKAINPKNKGHYQKSIAEIVDKAAGNNNILVKFTTNVEHVSDPGEKAKGAMTLLDDKEKSEEESKYDEVYIIYWSTSKSAKTELGTSPLFEEVFHLDDAMEGLLDLKGGVEPLILLWAEAHAKKRVVDEIKGIRRSYSEFIPNKEDKRWTVKLPTAYGALRKMTAQEIQYFISNNEGKKYEFSVYDENFQVIPGATVEANITGEGAYNYLLKDILKGRSP